MRRLAYLVFALFMMVASWEANKSNTAIASNVIPEDAIRLRIIANSDSLQDQWLKRQVRDRVVEQMNTWVKELQVENQTEARETISKHLPELNELVQSEMKRYGFTYKSKTELGVVPFPTKMYGTQVYPAGNYEALRISIGDAKGKNWWCVLFPPLCFVDFSNTQQPQADGKAAVTTASTLKSNPDNSSQAVEKADSNQQPIQVKFFLWELILKIKQAIFG